jgi:DNA repair protein RadC
MHNQNYDSGQDAEIKNLTLHDLPPSERPRERLKKFGQHNLSDQELLALILGKGHQGESIMVTVQKILSKFGSLKSLSEASYEEIIDIKGLGIAKVSQLIACFEISRRLTIEIDQFQAKKNSLISLTTPDEVYRQIKERLINDNKEHFFVISLDSRNRIIGIDPISTGTLTASLVHPRETFESAIKRHAAQIIVAHNHPSGSLEPSEDDIKITKRLIEAGKIMGIEVLDHLIISSKTYLSFRQEDLI